MQTSITIKIDLKITASLYKTEFLSLSNLSIKRGKRIILKSIASKNLQRIPIK